MTDLNIMYKLRISTANNPGKMGLPGKRSFIIQVIIQVRCNGMPFVRVTSAGEDNADWLLNRSRLVRSFRWTKTITEVTEYGVYVHQYNLLTLRHSTSQS